MLFWLIIRYVGLFTVLTGASFIGLWLEFNGWQRLVLVYTFIGTGAWAVASAKTVKP